MIPAGTSQAASAAADSSCARRSVIARGALGAIGSVQGQDPVQVVDHALHQAGGEPITFKPTTATMNVSGDHTDPGRTLHLDRDRVEAQATLDERRELV